MSDSKLRIAIVATVAVGGLGALLFFVFRGSGGGGGSGGATGYKKHLQAGAIKFPAADDPRLATQVALYATRDGTVTTVGGLVGLTRGPAEVTFPGERTKNALHMRAPQAFIEYIQENYLPATATAMTFSAGGAGRVSGTPAGSDSDGDAGSVGSSSAAAAATGSSSSSSSASSVVATLAVERSMMRQLVASDVALRRVERDRATPFDNDDRGHANLLQQLWVAAGRPMATYARAGKQWGDLGFQGDDPATDLRGSGILGLRQLVRFTQRQPQAVQGMMAYNRAALEEKRDSWFLLAVTSFQFTAQLLLQRDHCLHAAHLKILHDTLTPDTTATTTSSSSSSNKTNGNNSSGGGGGGASTTAAASRPVSRAAREADVAAKAATASGATALTLREAAVKVWTDGEYASDAEAGLGLLHELLLLHFKACWEAESPHVMSYNTFVPERVFATFFTANWTP